MKLVLMVKNSTTVSAEAVSSSLELETENRINKVSIRAALMSLKKDPKQKTINSILVYSKSLK